MKGAPAWVTYVTAAVAVMALMVSIATYLRAGSRIRVKVSLSSWRAEDPEIIVTVINRGLASVDLISLTIGFQAIIGLVYIAELSDSNYRSDKSLLHRLEPGSQRNWHYPLSGLGEKVDAGIGTATLNWFISKLPSGRPRIKWRLYRSFIPFSSFLQLLMAGLVVSVDLGNGVQRNSLPNHVLMMRLLPYMEKSRQKDPQATKLDKPNDMES
jgi:hypothetical protein